MKESRLMYEGDLWLNGKGLAVKKPMSTDATYKAILADMEEGFATQNVVEEVVDRRRDGILGREPIWTLPVKEGEPTDAQKNTIDEITKAVTEWWNKREMLDLMRTLFVDACLDRRVEIRPFVPSTAYDASGGLKSVSNIADALDLLHFEAISADKGAVFLAEDSLEPYSVYEYEKDGDKIREVSQVGVDGKTHLARIKERDYSFAEQNLPTIAQYIVNKTASSETVKYVPLDLDGKLYLYELDLKRVFVSDPMKSLQKQISLDKTMQGRNTYTAGFRSKHWLNARPPQGTREVSDATAPGGKRKEKYDKPMQDGAGVNSFVQGAFIYDENGNIKGIADPRLVITDPVEVKTFIESKEDNRAGILAMADQVHILISDKASVSGISRQDARGEFRQDLKGVKSPIDSLGRYVVEFAVMFAANLTNRVDEFKQFRCDFNSIVDAGTLSPDEKADNRAAYEAGEISLETLMSRNGVEDTDAELETIKSEDGFEINRLKKVLEVLELANGKLPLKLQIEFLVKSLGKEDEWDVEEMTAQALKETAKVPAMNGNGVGVMV